MSKSTLVCNRTRQSGFALELVVRTSVALLAIAAILFMVLQFVKAYPGDDETPHSGSAIEVLSILFGAGGVVSLIVLGVVHTRERRERTGRASDALASIKEKVESSVRLPEPDWSARFRKMARHTANVVNAKNTALTGCRIIVVVSGKGGVGKSTLSLGLMEYFSHRGNTLLVDFDMHNRGLSSLIGVSNSNASTVLHELEEFHKIYDVVSKIPAQAGTASSVDPTGQNSSTNQVVLDRYDALLREFVFRDDSPGRPRPLQLMTFEGANLEPRLPGRRKCNYRVQPKNCYFLPSIRLPDLFLGSSVFDAKFDEVFYFLRSLANWVGQPRPDGGEAMNTMIVDCHGAHDLLMVGAIHAADALAIVATPEPGSFDGTLDLVTFSRNMVTATNRAPVPSALVLNNCRPHEVEVAQQWVDFYSHHKNTPDYQIVQVPAHASIRDVTGSYSVGQVSQNPILWHSIEAIVHAIEKDPPGPPGPPGAPEEPGSGEL